MLTFLQFLEERKVDPEKLATRVARRFGKKEKYGKWLRTEPGGHIPLKNYRAKEADSVFNKSDKVRKKVGGRHAFDSSNKEEHEKSLQRYRDLHKKKTMDIKDLHPTQPFVSTHDPEKLKKKVREKNPGGIIVATHKGKHYVLDGHHRVMGAVMRGEKKVEVSHINLDEH